MGWRVVLPHLVLTLWYSYFLVYVFQKMKETFQVSENLEGLYFGGARRGTIYRATTQYDAFECEISTSFTRINAGTIIAAGLRSP